MELDCKGKPSSLVSGWVPLRAAVLLCEGFPCLREHLGTESWPHNFARVHPRALLSARSVAPFAGCSCCLIFPAVCWLSDLLGWLWEPSSSVCRVSVLLKLVYSPVITRGPGHLGWFWVESANYCPTSCLSTLCQLDLLLLLLDVSVVWRILL